MSSVSTDKPVRVAVQELLSDWHLEILSDNAQKLYEACWHRMRITNSTIVWMNDIEASRRARILIRYVPSARAELINAGVLDCWQGHNEWRYTYLELNESEQ